MLGLKNSISEENLQRRSPVKTKGKEKTNRWSSKTTTVPASPPKPPPSIPTPPNNKLTPLSAPSAHPGATPQPGQQNPTGFAYTYGDAYPPVKKQVSFIIFSTIYSTFADDLESRATPPALRVWNIDWTRFEPKKLICWVYFHFQAFIFL